MKHYAPIRPACTAGYLAAALAAAVLFFPAAAHAGLVELALKELVMPAFGWAATSLLSFAAWAYTKPWYQFLELVWYNKVFALGIAVWLFSSAKTRWFAVLASEGWWIMKALGFVPILGRFVGMVDGVLNKMSYKGVSLRDVLFSGPGALRFGLYASFWLPVWLFYPLGVIGLWQGLLFTAGLLGVPEATVKGFGGGLVDTLLGKITGRRADEENEEEEEEEESSEVSEDDGDAGYADDDAGEAPVIETRAARKRRYHSY